MVRSAELSAREARIAELKRLITSRHYDSLEKLEDAVEAFLWGEEDTEAPALTLPIGSISAGTASRAFRGPLNPR